MAKMFYTAEEAAAKLGITEDDVKGLVRDAKLREFRDAGDVSYKVPDVDKLVGTVSTVSDAIASASGELILEPADDSGIELSAAGSDIISLEDTGVGDTASGRTAIGKGKEDSVVPSVGVNVFDDDDVDEEVDPLASTAVTDLAGLGIDGVGSGSGILDLTRESDDTSLGKELLDEIYTDEESGGTGTGTAMGESTRAGLEEGLPDGTGTGTGLAPAEEEAPVLVAAEAMATSVGEFAPDAVSSSLTAWMAVSVLVMLVGGLGAAALARGILPWPLDLIHGKLMIFAGGALALGILAAAGTYFVNKRSG